MAENLFPVIELPKTITIKKQYDQSYKPSYQWDFEIGDFVRNGANKIPMCSGQEAYKTWCIKAIATERKTCLSYPHAIGAEMITAFQKPTQRTQESAIERTIKETLLVNPRTEYVRDFSFNWCADFVQVTFKVKAIGEEEFQLSV